MIIEAKCIIASTIMGESIRYIGLLRLKSNLRHGSSWTEVGEYCMHGYSTKAVWAVAEENCKSYSPTLGSHLVSIHNMQENTEVMHQMAKCTCELFELVIILTFIFSNKRRSLAWNDEI